MRKILPTIIIALIMTFSGQQLMAQLFFKGGVGYGLGTQKILLDEIYTSSYTENIYASFGGNIGIYFGGGIQLNEYVELGADIAYQHGRSVFIDNLFMSKTYTGRLIMLNPAITFKTLIYENISPYGRLGLFTGVPLTSVIVGSQEKKFRGGLPFGANGAIGVDFNISDGFKIFTEVTRQSMIYKPTRRREMDGTVYRFRDSLEYPAPQNEEITHHFFSFGAMGVNIGFKILL